MLWFPAPASFTGEDVVELHVHGGSAVVAGTIGVLGRCEGLRIAEPGEFTRRAFENGKFDLTQAEALGDLINAETTAQRRQALRQLSGDFGALCNRWRNALVASLAHLEAAIDFPDEDLPEGIADTVANQILGVREEVARYLDDDHRGERLRQGAYVVILGAPNVGKSSLLNRLARREAAIVSARAGTTRDVIEVNMDLGGYPVTLADTAGLRDARDEIEEEGVRRARDRAAIADLCLDVRDASRPNGAAAKASGGENTLIVWNKSDLLDGARTASPGHAVSALTGDGIEDLVRAIREVVADEFAGGTTAIITRERHRRSLEACAAAVGRFQAGREIALGAEDLRLAVRALGRITGRVNVEDLLDVVFRDFCIGK